MSDKQKQIMESIKESIENAMPNMNETEKSELLGIAKGIAMMAEQRKTA